MFVQQTTPQDTVRLFAINTPRINLDAQSLQHDENKLQQWAALVDRVTEDRLWSSSRTRRRLNTITSCTSSNCLWPFTQVFGAIKQGTLALRWYVTFEQQGYVFKGARAPFSKWNPHLLLLYFNYSPLRWWYFERYNWCRRLHPTTFENFVIFHQIYGIPGVFISFH